MKELFSALGFVFYFFSMAAALISAICVFCTMLLVFTAVNAVLSALLYIYGDPAVRFILVVGQLVLSLLYAVRSYRFVRYLYEKSRLWIINLSVIKKDLDFAKDVDSVSIQCPLCNGITKIPRDTKKAKCRSCGAIMALEAVKNENR